MTKINPVSFNIAFLKERAAELAQTHEALIPGKKTRPVKPILEKSRDTLSRSYRVLSAHARSDRDLSPAAEWLIDNFYIIQEQILQTTTDFPKAFQKSLPIFENGEHRGLPYVFELIHSLLNHTDHVVDKDVLNLYVQRYQEDRRLTLGEFWAVPIMIRLHLIDTLSRKASKLLYQKEVQDQVRNLLERLDSKRMEEPGMFAHELSVWLDQPTVINESYVLVEIYNQLQNSGRLSEEEKRWILYRLRQNEMTLDEAMRIEARRESRLQVSIQNAVNSLRQTSEMDWNDFVEECSVVEKILRLDPAGAYPFMDVQTRDGYRRVVERLSKRSGKSETEVAEELLLMVEEAERETREELHRRRTSESWIRRHVGYFLKGNGYDQLIQAIGYKMPVKERVIRNLERNSVWYLSSILFGTLILVLVFWYATQFMDPSFGVSTVFVLVIALFPALELSVSLVNRFFSFFLPPRILPKMEFKSGIPDESRTLVVVPTLLSSLEDVRSQIEHLEIRSLANPDQALQYVLLSDYADAHTNVTDSDQEILELASNLISSLNKQVQSRFGDKFFMLHRERVWNEQEGVWMGWERKRGKLEELNRLLLDPSSKTTFTHVEGNFIPSIQRFPVRYVITLDSDTRLPPDCARNLVRTIAHPLNQARFSESGRQIIEGYGIIQPRISIAPDASGDTWFSKIFSGNVGLDPYSAAVSDIYQDLTGEAIYTGKGIYDVEAFHQALDQRFPDNRILSHDLIESIYARTGFASDIELFDSFPTTYTNFSKRNHRWTRGDWQIASWLLPRSPSRNGKVRNTLGRLSRWKIFDNLRRSLNPFFLMVFFLSGWFLLPGEAWVWTAAALGILAYPIYVSLYGDVRNRPTRVRWKLYFEKVRVNLKRNSLLSLFAIVILPHQAMIQLDAVVRTLYRLTISRKRLLEWTSAYQLEKHHIHSLTGCIRSQIGSIIVGLLVLVTAFLFSSPATIWIVLPFCVMWVGSPIWLWLVSFPSRKPVPRLSGDELKLIREYARRTWFYFERFVNEENNWLPPDNYQVDPPVPVTERTSPTNIGLALVATQVAYNRGYITLGELLERVCHTLRTMGKLERHHGHFFNWYETRLGDVLSPRYISTVDSGNLAASLVTIRESIKRSMNQPGIFNPLVQGLTDTIRTVQRVLCDAAEGTSADRHHIQDLCLKMLQEVEAMESIPFPEWMSYLKRIRGMASDLTSVALVSRVQHLSDSEIQDLLMWQERPLKMLEQVRVEMQALMAMDGVDLEHASAEDLIRLSDQEGQPRITSQMLIHWKTLSGEIIERSGRFVDEMNFTFLYLPKRGLFSIGYNVDKVRLDKGTYDLLASESRIASYLAIAKGDVPVEHWFRLSRRLTHLSRQEILLSWGGTMFEYLMPLLFLRRYPETLLYHTGQYVVEWQKTIGEKRKQPWGYSESAYYFLNMDLQYQYRAFGAPGLGLRRGLAEEYVVAPYASMLSMMIDPVSSLKNLKRLEEIGGFGLYGFYEAVDFTPIRMNSNETFKWVKTYMAHHHGMSLLAIENVLNEWEIQSCFHNDLRIRSCELILQEKVPRGVPIKEPHPVDVELEPAVKEVISHVVEHAGMEQIDISPPRLQMLSNGDYSLMLTHAGTGSSRARGISLTNWTPDPVQDPLGFFVYIRDQESGEFWSAMHQPTKKQPDRYDTWFHNGKVVTSRVDQWIETTTMVAISPDDPIELRRLTLTNYSSKRRTLDLTSYAEVVLNREESHNAHPAFSKLFLQTDYLADHHSILVKRRPRDADEKPLWMIHTLAGEEQVNLIEPLQFETERRWFIGRGRSLENPAAMDKGSRLSGTIGNVLDPIVSLRITITLEPGEHKHLIFGLGYAESREEAERLADTYDNLHAAERTFELATVYSNVELNHLGITSKEAHGFQKLASYLLYSDNAFRAGNEILRSYRGVQRDLWVHGISGDDPMIVFRVREVDQIGSVKRLLKAHEFWRQKGLNSELILINDEPSGYFEELQDSLMMVVQNSSQREMLNQRSGVFILRSDILSDKELSLILSVCHVLFEKTVPDLSKLNREAEITSWLPVRTVVQSDNSDMVEPPETKKESSIADKADLHFFNGYGGFSERGESYVIIIEPDPDTGLLRFPPAPWINVISNPIFGFLVSEKGAGYTWSLNSRENKLTEWSNDPVSDPHSEAFYIRDNANSTYWSPTPGPVPTPSAYKVTHGFGYTRFENSYHSIASSLTQYVDTVDPVRISTWTIENKGHTSMDLSLFRYQDRVLGVERDRAARMVVQESVNGGQTIRSRNHFNNEFAGRVVFTTVSTVWDSVEISSTMRRELFLGRNHSLIQPAALQLDREWVSDEEGVEDPCAAFQIKLNLNPGERITLNFLDGESESVREADDLIRKYGVSGEVEKSLQRVHTMWESKLGQISVSTPDRSLDILLNGWLLYQTISCRMWGRSAFYQAGGAFGYRDQLQDSMAVLYADSEMTRNQILLHAGKQFEEGDVLHWWHPPSGRGIRSRITDDRLWLPYVTDLYIRTTGDRDILEEKISWVTSRPLDASEQEVYLQPGRSEHQDSLYEHCCRAIDISLTFGKNGLPLIGSGDWNDGMNRIGEKGEGESVWLGFFLVGILRRFSIWVERHGDTSRSERYKSLADDLSIRLNNVGWDGEWYLRAFYDDGTPVGSSRNTECRIDSIVQSWAVLSGVAEKTKADMALLSAEKLLVSEPDRLIRLLTPPFDATEKDPGYIKGYIPGVRENGGQYTHAALWLINAMAESGWGEKAVHYLDMINPVNLSKDREGADRYMLEPYVIAADVYGEQPLAGMGGWSWYTGSGSWFYRVALESILGLRLEHPYLTVKPAISTDWDGYELRLKVDESGTIYSIQVRNPNQLATGLLTGTIDGTDEIQSCEQVRIPLKSDGKQHVVQLTLVPLD